MNLTTAFIAGLLVGWLVEWVIDWAYWRKRVKTVPYKDPFEIISGVGAVITQKLYDAGIYTFADLAKLKHADLEEIVGPQIRNLADEDALINEAKKFAREISMARRK